MHDDFIMVITNHVVKPLKKDNLKYLLHIFSLACFKNVGAPPSQSGGILTGVPALHGNQNSDLGGE